MAEAVVCAVSDVPENSVQRFEIGTSVFAVYNIGGTFYATDNECTHGSASLADGILEGGIIECTLHCGREPPQVMLQHIVGGPALQCLDRVVLSDRARYKDERYVRAQLACNVQRIDTAEPRHTEVRKDDVGQPVTQLLAELRLRVDTPCGTREARTLQCMNHEFSIVDLVFDHHHIE